MSTETAEYPETNGWQAGAENAYDGAPVPFQPYIPASVRMRELSVRALAVGALLGTIFGASSLYLVLKVGLTVVSSIPISVISITFFRMLSRLGMKDATVLENNIIQTTGSVGESIAFGVGVTMPAVMILGFDLDVTQTMLAAVLGSALGVLLVVPLRRVLIVQEHGELKYPEGVACAEVLELGASQESRAAAKGAGVGQLGARSLFLGFGVSFFFYSFQQIFKTWKEVPTKVFGRLFEGSISVENNPALLGIGYIIGPRVASIMVAGGVFTSLILIPAIKYFGAGLAAPLAPETAHRIADMSVWQIQRAYVLYIGVGAVVTGGLVSLCRSLPVIWGAMKESLGDILQSGRTAGAGGGRTDRDLPSKVLTGDIVILLIVAALAPSLHLPLWGTLMLFALAFTFVAVSARLTGQVGSSSNPVSGITIGVLLITCGVFALLGATGAMYSLAAICIGAVVCVAVTVGGTAAQNLKTGFILGATPRYQQIAMLVGALTSSLLIAPLLLKVNQVGTVYVPLVAFEPAVKSAGRLPTLQVQTLKLYEGISKPPSPGRFRVFDSPGTGAGENGLAQGRYLVEESTGKVAYKFKDDLQLLPPARREIPASELGGKETVQGEQQDSDQNTYNVWYNADPAVGPVGKYLVDEENVPQYYVDPGINGTFPRRPDGSTVTKYDAPKATLMAYIVKGVLGGHLPWGLVLIGVALALVIELSGVPSLPFAVGLYLPLSSSSPIFVGGAIRWAVDHARRRREARAGLAGTDFAEEEEGERSPGVLISAGYITGASLAGVITAFVYGLPSQTTNNIEAWMQASNPFYGGSNADLMSLLPLSMLCALLYYVARGRMSVAEGGE